MKEETLIKRIAKDVAKDIPSYVGVTGDALESLIAKGITKYITIQNKNAAKKRKI